MTVPQCFGAFRRHRSTAAAGQSATFLPRRWATDFGMSGFSASKVARIML